MFTPTLKGYTENEKLYCLNFGLYTLVISIAAIAYGIQRQSGCGDDRGGPDVGMTPGPFVCYGQALKFK